MVALFSVCCLRSRGSACGCRHATSLLLLPLILAQITYAVAVPEQAAATPLVLGVREQCGGLLWSGSLTSGSPMDAPYPQVKCGEGLKCHRDSKWYYECVPEVDSAWRLEKALHADSAAEEIPTVQIEANVESVESAESTPEHSSDVFDDMEEKETESVLEHYMKEGAEVIKSVFQHDDKATAEKDKHHQEYSLARTLASWAHRRQMKTDNVDLEEAVGIKNRTDQYAQCGGLINAPEGQSKDGVWDGERCWDGWSCNRVNQWYYQCQPITNYNRPTTVVEVNGVKKEVLDVWAQCGGKGGQVPDNEKPLDGPYPSYICFPNTNCTRQNEWYWQCLPNPGFHFGGPGGSPTPQSSPVPPTSPSPPPVYPSPDSQEPAGYSPPIYPSPPFPGYITYPSPPAYYSPSPSPSP